MKAMLRKKYNPQQECGKMLYRYEYFVFKINHVIMFCSENRIINKCQGYLVPRFNIRSSAIGRDC